MKLNPRFVIDDAEFKDGKIILLGKANWRSKEATMEVLPLELDGAFLWNIQTMTRPDDFTSTRFQVMFAYQTNSTHFRAFSLRCTCKHALEAVQVAFGALMRWEKAQRESLHSGSHPNAAD